MGVAPIRENDEDGSIESFAESHDSVCTYICSIDQYKIIDCCDDGRAFVLARKKI